MFKASKIGEGHNPYHIEAHLFGKFMAEAPRCPPALEVTELKILLAGEFLKDFPVQEEDGPDLEAFVKWMHKSQPLRAFARQSFERVVTALFTDQPVNNVAVCDESVLGHLRGLLDPTFLLSAWMIYAADVVEDCLKQIQTNEH